MLGDLRQTILDKLPSGDVEGLRKGTLSYVVPLSTYPHAYNQQPLLLAALASQMAFVTLYLMAVYSDKKLERWFRDAYARSGRRPDIGRSCVHVKKLQDIPHSVVGAAIGKVSVQEYIRLHEAARSHRTSQ